jgi:hypothetical protein
MCAHPESLGNAGIPGHSCLFRNYKYLILTPSPHTHPAPSLILTPTFTHTHPNFTHSLLSILNIDCDIGMFEYCVVKENILYLMSIKQPFIDSLLTECCECCHRKSFLRRKIGFFYFYLISEIIEEKKSASLEKVSMN